MSLQTINPVKHIIGTHSHRTDDLSTAETNRRVTRIPHPIIPLTDASLRIETEHTQGKTGGTVASVSSNQVESGDYHVGVIDTLSNEMDRLHNQMLSHTESGDPQH